jgi:hypothetical protein
MHLSHCSRLNTAPYSSPTKTIAKSSPPSPVVCNVHLEFAILVYSWKASSHLGAF